MKNKKNEQIENKKRHKEELKRRRTAPDLTRKPPTKLERPLILIVCEGENTEKSYFDHFRLTSAQLVTLGKGYNTLSLVAEAIRLSKQSNANYEQVWCVFDKDTFAAQDFNSAISIAEANGFQVAYSNQAFEYWLLLHFEDHQGGAMPRQDYDKKINHYINPLGASYEGQGNKIVSRQFFELLEEKPKESDVSRRETAIKRAKRNYDRFDHSSPANEESSTKVFLLVEEIMKYL
jgi:hypothetical protein